MDLKRYHNWSSWLGFNDRIDHVELFIDLENRWEKSSVKTYFGCNNMPHYMGSWDTVLKPNR